MCGNFGLLRIILRQSGAGHGSTHGTSGHGSSEVNARRANSRRAITSEVLDMSRSSKLDGDLVVSLHEQVHEVSKAGGIIADSGNDFLNKFDKLSKTRTFVQLFKDLAALTEFRGGQAGGISTFEYSVKDVTMKPKVARMRCVGRKRYTLADDMAQEYERLSTAVKCDLSTFTAIAHTRFATSSVNVQSELHPHEWTPFHEENVWRFDEYVGKFVEGRQEVGVHITHNGDFNAINAYGQELVNQELGLWLEKVLHVKSNLQSDSVKIAGMLDLYRVQGRWAASVRLGWVRAVMEDFTDAFVGKCIQSDCPSACPTIDFWESWASVFEHVWKGHINNIVVSFPSFEVGKFMYRIDSAGLKQFEAVMVNMIWAFVQKDTALQTLALAEGSSLAKVLSGLVKENWTWDGVRAFVHHSVRGFLKGDLYNATTELLSRMIGSFGCQFHCTLEPGVVCIASKGQPMAVAFDPELNICIFGSESEALSVVVDDNGRWLKELINLDIEGEVVRVGIARSLIEGSFEGDEEKEAAAPNRMYEHLMEEAAANAQVHDLGECDPLECSTNDHRTPTELSTQDDVVLSDTVCYGMRLNSGIELRSYSLTTFSEGTEQSIAGRCVHINYSPVRTTPSADLVGDDLKVIPRVLSTIDRAWSRPKSLDTRTSSALADKLTLALTSRKKNDRHKIDLIIGGVEVSLWMAEQFAADLRSVFDAINVVVVSTNKLLGLGDHNAQRVFFPGCDGKYENNIDEYTCALLISQSGQTFPSLHTLHKLTKFVEDRVWILTGAFHSQMETALVKSFTELGKVYKQDRVFNNYAGKRPAEPSTVAVAATWHTMSHILLSIVETVQKRHPHRCQRYSWEEELEKRAKMEAMKPDTKKGPHRCMASAEAHAEEEKATHTIMSMTKACIRDYRSLLVSDALVHNVSNIVGHSVDGSKIEDATINNELRIRGSAWAAHINEPWLTLIYSGVYIFVTVTLDIPIFSLLATVILAIIDMAGVDLGDGSLSFSLCNPSTFLKQSPAWFILGLLVQALDAIVYIYIGKVIAKSCRVVAGRPFDARLGKRTLIIVDTPAVHQMLENYVSKLFSMSYSFVSIDVHGASGLDHFVHRFTHRVTRGAMIAVGRPDGRLCCLSKSETSILLSTKQATFIRNPTYSRDGSGPDIVSVGHNPFTPHLGLANHVTLGRNSLCSSTRRQFLDEYLFEKLIEDKKPDGSGLLYYIRDLYESFVIDYVSGNRNSKPSVTFIQPSLSRADVRDELQESIGKLWPVFSRTSASVFEDLSCHSKHSQHGVFGRPRNGLEILPYGLHHVPKQSATFATVLRGLQLQTSLKKKQHSSAEMANTANDPEKRLIFSQRLDALSRRVQASQQTLQFLYEGRIASLERYIAFCVIFYHMAKDCSTPALLRGWDIARSQSNLRVATTASPIPASVDERELQSRETMRVLCKAIHTLRGFTTYH